MNTSTETIRPVSALGVFVDPEKSRLGREEYHETLAQTSAHLRNQHLGVARGAEPDIKRPVNLATVPDEEWDPIASLGFDAVWFMGVWERSPAGIEISMRNEGLLQDFRRALPDFTAADNVGSPYCVRRYVVDEHLGGPRGSGHGT